MFGHAFSVIKNMNKYDTDTSAGSIFLVLLL
jgi:hypothetical protein